MGSSQWFWPLILDAGSLWGDNPVILCAAALLFTHVPGLEIEMPFSFMRPDLGKFVLAKCRARLLCLVGWRAVGWGIKTHSVSLPFLRLCILWALPCCCQTMQQFHSLECASDVSE